VKAGYETPEAWSSGPDRVYEALSMAVVAERSSALRGRRVLDLGAGTGATSRAVRAVGGRPVAVDASWEMLAHGRVDRPPAIVGDGCAVPLADGAVGATVAAFVLSHVEDPEGLLREVGRVTAPGGTVIVVSFAGTGTRATVGTVVEEVLRGRGWVPPAWFRHMKEELEPVVADPERLLTMASSSGLRTPVVTTHVVDTGIDDPDDLVDWRLGSPGVAWFVAAMPARERRDLHAEAVAALGPGRQPLVLDLRVLVSRAATARRSVSA
jgi:SAM-dependent methyltransferase